jgi:hypothetical protein
MPRQDGAHGTAVPPARPRLAPQAGQWAVENIGPRLGNCAYTVGARGPGASGILCIQNNSSGCSLPLLAVHNASQHHCWHPWPGTNVRYWSVSGSADCANTNALKQAGKQPATSARASAWSGRAHSGLCTNDTGGGQMTFLPSAACRLATSGHVFTFGRSVCCARLTG